MYFIANQNKELLIMLGKPVDQKTGFLQGHMHDNAQAA